MVVADRRASRISGALTSPKRSIDDGISTGGNEPPSAIACQGVTKRFGTVAAVDGLDLTVPTGQVLALLGPSGCGKTTALRLIAGFDEPDAGVISLSGQTVNTTGNSLPSEKRRVGMVFQEGALFPHLTVAQNIAYGLPRDSRKNGRVDEVLALVGLSDLKHRMPFELSGGQQQRVALGRALAPRPALLLLDEPFSNLDPKLREQVRRDVMEIVRSSGCTTIFVTHDQEEALFVGDTIAVMNQGRVEQIGPPEEIFHSPATRFVAQFIGMVDFLPAWRDGGSLVTEVGSMKWNIPESDCQLGAGAAGQDLEVMVRPDCVDCYPSDSGEGVIVDREFRGAFYLYRVALPSGHSVRCLLPHTTGYPVGEAVAVTLRQGHHLKPFIGQRALDSQRHGQAEAH